MVGTNIERGLGSNVGMPTFDLLETPLAYSNMYTGLSSIPVALQNPNVSHSAKDSRDASLPDLFTAE